MKNTDAAALVLEKYKYILARKHALNESTFKIAAIYQALIIGLGVAQYNILVSVNAKAISSRLAMFSSAGLMIMLIIVTTLILCMLVGGIFAWSKYRKEESGIEFKAIGTKKDPATFKSIFSWYETYLAMVVLLVGALGLYAYVAILFPELKSVSG